MLGPPVCEKCQRVYYLFDKDWKCEICGETETNKHLFCCSDSELEQMDKKWGTKLLEDRKYWQERIRKAKEGK